MSTYYYLYTEIKINNKWHCINNKVKNIDNEKYELSTTYYSGSRTYFGETYNKLESISKPIDKNELSDELKEKYGTEMREYEILPRAVSLEDIKECVPSEKIKEYHGYVHKDIISRYLIGEQEDIYDCISIKKYRKLNAEEKLLYDYFEWDDSQGWFKYFKIILKHIKWQLFEWKDVNFLKEVDGVRIIVFMF